MTTTALGAPATMLALLTAKPGQEEVLRDLIETLTPQVRAEDGCLAFLPLRDRESPDRYYIYEQYRDEDAFRQHLDTAYVKAFRAGAAEAATDALIDSALRRIDELATDHSPRNES